MKKWLKAIIHQALGEFYEYTTHIFHVNRDPTEFDNHIRGSTWTNRSTGKIFYVKNIKTEWEEVK